MSCRRRAPPASKCAKSSSDRWSSCLPSRLARHWCTTVGMCGVSHVRMRAPTDAMTSLSGGELAPALALMAPTRGQSSRADCTTSPSIKVSLSLSRSLVQLTFSEHACGDSMHEISDSSSSHTPSRCCTDARELECRLHQEMKARQQVEEDLNRSRDEIAKVSEPKSWFVTTISHELRSPLHGTGRHRSITQGTRPNPIASLLESHLISPDT